MTARSTFLFVLSRASLGGLVAAIGVLVGPANANKDPVTPQQLQAYQEAFMDEVKKGDLLFHGDEATAKEMGVTLSTTGMACAMCHPFAISRQMAAGLFRVHLCPDSCPTTLNEIATALEKLGADAAKVKPLFITIDPQRDTREVLEQYTQSFDPRIVGTHRQSAADRCGDSGIRSLRGPS